MRLAMRTQPRTVWERLSRATGLGRPTFLVAIFLAAIIAAGEAVTAAQTTCIEIRGGQSASSAARRLTGDPQSFNQPWFQILKPSPAVFVPKSSYDRIQAGWYACLLPPPSRQTMAGSIDVSRGGGGVHNRDQAFVLLAIVAFAAVCLGTSADGYLNRRRVALDAMKHFAADFVREFERPLTQSASGARPIESRVRLRPDRGRLDILLAPANGNSYPNLADHRSNLVYDVARVSRQLQSPAFVCDQPYAQRGWVVVPFSLQLPKQVGGQ